MEVPHGCLTGDHLRFITGTVVLNEWWPETAFTQRAQNHEFRIMPHDDNGHKVPPSAAAEGDGP